MRERVETETKTPEKISDLEERGDDERRMEQEEALWWSRGEKEVPLVWQEDPEEPEGPPKTESPKMAKVLEKVEAPKVPRGPLRIEMPVESSKPIDEEKCDTRDFRSKSNKAKEEETEVEPIPVEKTSVAGIKEHPMETKEERVNHEDTKTEEGMRAMEVREYRKRQGTQKRKEVGRAGIGRRVAVTYLLPPRYPWNPWNGRRKRSAWKSGRMETDIGATP